MPSYNVYLGDVNSGLTTEQKNNVRTTLQGWFGRIVPERTTAIVSWVNSAPSSISDTELLVYFVASSFDSVVRALPGGGRAGSNDGFTAWAGGLTASEVYVSSSRTYLAELAFHELMHNKLHLDDAALHSRDGLARFPLNPGTNPSTTNISQMRAALNNRHPQWTGGWTAANDPLAGVL